MSSSKTRHMSLLDALDKSDPNRDEDDAHVGEEKVRGVKKKKEEKKSNLGRMNSLDIFVLAM